MLYKTPSFMPNPTKLSTNNLKPLLMHCEPKRHPSAVNSTIKGISALLQPVQ